MRDARWQDVLGAARSAGRHFEGAARILASGTFDETTDEGYRNLMAFLHAMQAGHTSVEDALLRVLDIIGEEAPSGRDWHADLIRRCSRPMPERRPAILTPELASAAHETRSFRHRAMHSYDVRFSVERARYPAASGLVLARGLPGAIAAVAEAIDPSATAHKGERT